MFQDTDLLFEPFTLKSMELPNRIVMAPMTRSFATGGMVDGRHAAYYSARAAGGVGLILSEGAVIDRPASRNEPDVPFFHGDALRGWRAVVDSVHDAGAAFAPQIWHTGAVRSMTTDWEPEVPVESPSGLMKPGEPRGEAMTEAAIADTVAAFAKAASDARDLGCDAVEVHGAHGYLVDQFFWGGTNHRTDRYGGPTLKERSRFAAEVIGAIRAAVGEDFPIILRISQWKQQDLTVRLATTPNEMSDWLCPLVDAGVDLLHCSQRRFWTPEFPELDGENGLNFAGWAKKLTGAATISVGSVGLSGDFINAFLDDDSKPTSIDGLLERMARREFDLIAIGRALITNPDWAKRVRTGDLDTVRPFKTADLAQFT